MKKFIFISCFFLMGCVHTPHSNHPLDPQSGLPTTTVSIGSQIFTVEIARSPEERERGLMFRTSMPHDHGMLFVFETDNFHSFWMKNTKIPLDIAWISKDKKIVDVQNMQPCNQNPCQTYIPQAPAQFVLEVNKGQFFGKIGDFIEGNF